MRRVDDLLLLFRTVRSPARRAMAARLLGLDPDEDVDLWELHDVTAGDDEEPAAVAATRPPGEATRVRLLAVTTGGGSDRESLGPRMVDEVADALRARGVLVMERAKLGTGSDDVVWFDVEL